MIIAVDETGDANLGIPRPKFAVGALYLLDEGEAASIIDAARTQIGDGQHIFHYSHDGPLARQALSDAIDESQLDFHFRVVAYDGAIPSGYTDMAQPDVHSQLLAHALNLVLFLPTDSILLSARQSSLAQTTLGRTIAEIVRAGEWLAVNLQELRRNPLDLSERVQLVNGTDAPVLQICDHLLARWQTSIRDGVAWPVPRRSVAISAPRMRQYYTMAQIYRGGFSALDIAKEYSLQREAAGPAALPLFGAYAGLLSVPENQWNPQDHELIRLLLNEEEEKLHASEELIAHLCYLALEGRTRWPKHVPLVVDSFGLFSALASAFLQGTHSELDMATVAFDAVRFQIVDFREALRDASARVRGATSDRSEGN